MITLDVINSLANTNSRLEKEQIIFDAFMKGERNFFIGAKLALDPLISFGVAKVANIIDQSDDNGLFTFNDFLSLCSKLKKRELTGHAARDAINAAAEICHVDTWNLFYRRILLKDLKVGVEEKTINKVLNKIAQAYPEANDYIIPVFGCQLAMDGTDEKHSKKMIGNKIIQCKLDGSRFLSVLDKESSIVTIFTRSGKINENFSLIKKGLENLLTHIPGSIVLDGEIVSSSFQVLMTQVNRKENVDTSDAKLALFDIIPLNSFKKGICNKTQLERHNMLTQLQESGLLSKTCGNLVYILPAVEVDLDTEDGQRVFNEFNKNAIESGFEGIMVKDPNAPYECKRTSSWLKIKPVISVDLTIKDIVEGTGKYEGQLGALICEGIDGNKNISVNVGSGFTDDQRIEIFNNKDKLIDQIVEIKADCFSLAENSDIYSLRFPRFVRFRSINLIPGQKD